MNESELERLLAKVEELKKMVESGEIGEAEARARAASLSKALRKYGYLVVVRRRPRWSRGSGVQVFLSKLGRRGRRGARSDLVDDSSLTRRLERSLS